MVELRYFQELFDGFRIVISSQDVLHLYAGLLEVVCTIDHLGKRRTLFEDGVFELWLHCREVAFWEIIIFVSCFVHSGRELLLSLLVS